MTNNKLGREGSIKVNVISTPMCQIISQVNSSYLNWVIKVLLSFSRDVDTT